MRVLGVLSGNDMPAPQIEAWARWADLIYAADGGANVLLSLGIQPDVVVGDFDSVSEAARESAAEVLYSPSQEESDCDKLLALVEARGHTEVTLCNVEGDRLDHVLATLHSAARSPLEVRLALRTAMGVVVMRGREYAFDVAPDSRISLIPLETCEGVNLRGVKWELDESLLAPTGATSLSNIATGAVRVSMRTGVAVLFLPEPLGIER